METLEIKHLAAYLPYKIKIRVFRENESLFIEDVEITGEVIDYIFETKEYSKYKYKPILRPLSDLTKEIEVYGKRFVPANTEMLCNFQITNYKGFCFFDGFGSNVNIDEMPYYTIEKLLSWHFDIFGLIDKGLAVNINELEAVS